MSAVKLAAQYFPPRGYPAKGVCYSVPDRGLENRQVWQHTDACRADDSVSRYFRCRCTGVWRRTGHVLEMTFLTYDQHGCERLDPPQLVGAYGSGMLSTYWYPKGFSPLVQGALADGFCGRHAHGQGVHSGDQAHVATPQDVQHKLGKKQLKSLQNIMAAQRQ